MDKIKKILCYNVMNSNYCSYGNKCVYAHSLEEQNKEKYKKIIIDYIKNNRNLSNINIYVDEKLFNELLIFTKECKNCIYKKCNGGYNCKYGVCNPIFKICKQDLICGNCINIQKLDIYKNLKCPNGIHLSYKNLKNYNSYFENYIKINGKNIKQVLLNDVTINL